MKKYILKNHRFIEEKQAQIAINERGFLFGDGIFETCKIFNSQIYNFKAHRSRIVAGLKALQITAEIKDLEKNCLKLITKNQIKNGILRISITRGVGSAGYLPISKNSLIIAQTLKNRKTPQEISLTVSNIKKPPQNSFPINHKTNNALPYILNKLFAEQQRCFDAIMLTQENFISETSSANIFWVKNNKIYTSSKDCDILPGTVRARVLEIFSSKIIEKKAKLKELQDADEIFLTNAASLVILVDKLIFPDKNKLKTLKFSKKTGSIIKQLINYDVQKSCR
jgi:branched-chain amino acid aminotransferase